MAKRKLSDEPDIMFVNEAPGSEVTKTVSVKIKDFSKKFNVLLNKSSIRSPIFTVAGKDLRISILTRGLREDRLGKFIIVYLWNLSNERINITANFKSSFGGDQTMKNTEIPVGECMGYQRILSHDAFVNWARQNEDVFSLEAKITLHIESDSCWTTER